MMAIHKAGFFRELRHGDPSGPSLVECRDSLELNARAKVARYLRGGSVLATTGTMAGDWFNPSDTAVAPLEVRTDGTWAWPADLAYYVERYGVGLPLEMLDHMASHSWKASALSTEELLTAEAEFLAAPGVSATDPSHRR
jgi:hypothetical protein